MRLYKSTSYGENSNLSKKFCPNIKFKRLKIIRTLGEDSTIQFTIFASLFHGKSLFQGCQNLYLLCMYVYIHTYMVTYGGLISASFPCYKSYAFVYKI